MAARQLAPPLGDLLDLLEESIAPVREEDLIVALPFHDADIHVADLALIEQADDGVRPARIAEDLGEHIDAVGPQAWGREATALKGVRSKDDRLLGTLGTGQ